MKTIIQDTREKPQAIGKINKQLEANGYEIIRSKLYVGDYQFLDNPFLVVDRKQNLQELIGNVCQQHQRFKNELKRAMDHNIKVVVLVEHGSGINCLEDIKDWVNPRLKNSPKATKGENLYKILKTLSWNYQVEFQFCTKGETGLRIIEILEGGGAIGRK